MNLLWNKFLRSGFDYQKQDLEGRGQDILLQGLHVPLCLYVHHDEPCRIQAYYDLRLCL